MYRNEKESEVKVLRTVKRTFTVKFNLNLKKNETNV